MRDRIAELGWSPEQAEQHIGIPAGTLRNITRDGNPDGTNWRRVYRLRDVLGLPLHALLAKGDGTPDNPPAQPKGPKSPPPRRNEKTGSGPKRTQGAAA